MLSPTIGLNRSTSMDLILIKSKIKTRDLIKTPSSKTLDLIKSLKRTLDHPKTTKSTNISDLLHKTRDPTLDPLKTRSNKTLDPMTRVISGLLRN